MLISSRAVLESSGHYPGNWNVTYFSFDNAATIDAALDTMHRHS
jgi:hypothetical protein